MVLIPQEKIMILNAAGTEVTSSTSVATGQILSVDGVEYTIVLVGDTNGDGIISSGDVKVILDYLTGASHALDDSRAFLLAAKVIDGDITIETALYLQRYIYGFETTLN